MEAYDPEQDYDERSGMIAYTTLALYVAASHTLRLTRYKENYELVSLCDSSFDGTNLVELAGNIIDYSGAIIFSAISVT